MRILHVLDHSPPLQSGYVFRTMGILRAQRGLGWETIQLTAPNAQLDGSRGGRGDRRLCLQSHA